MKVLMAHNHYQQPGGEDQVFAAEADLLESRGHRVVRFTLHNERIEEMSQAELVRKTVWNGGVYWKLRELIREEDVAVAHFHNTFPLISPVAYHAAHAENVPVVQTLHNYRLLCPNGLFFRDGHACEDCLGKRVPWPGVAHACYRGSRAATAVVGGMLTAHRALGTWQEKVDVYIALTEFARRKFIQGGLPAEKILVKPNFVYPDPGASEQRGQYALFVGRLSAEKGVDTLLSAWENMGTRIPLKIAGDGPLASRVATASQQLEGVEWLGRQPADQVVSLMRHAEFLLFPSLLYEGFPMVIAEAYATGLPVIASDIGSVASLIETGRTGLRFRTGDSRDLESRVEWTLGHPEGLDSMRREARVEYEAKYTADRNYQELMQIYELAMSRA